VRVERAASATAKQTREVGAAQAKGEAQGAAIRATGLAEAEAIGKRAEALERVRRRAGPAMKMAKDAVGTTNGGANDATEPKS
jgi:hypothetical protein